MGWLRNSKDEYQKTDFTCKKQSVNARINLCRGWNNSNNKNYFDFTQTGAIIEYYGNEFVPGFGDAMKFKYDYVGLFISGGGILKGKGIIKPQLNKDTLDLSSNIGDFGFTSKSIYDKNIK